MSSRYGDWSANTTDMPVTWAWLHSVPQPRGQAFLLRYRVAVFAIAAWPKVNRRSYGKIKEDVIFKEVPWQ